MLPPPRADYSPMLGGRSAHFWAQMREAYEAQNLGPLLDALHTDEQMLFRRAIAWQSLAYIRRAILHRTNGWHHPVIDAAVSWIADPSRTPNRDALERSLIDGPSPMDLAHDQDDESHYSPLEDGLEILRALIGVLCDESLFEAARSVAGVKYYALLLDYSITMTHGERIPGLIYTVMTAWQIETAWAILQGEGVPPLTIEDVGFIQPRGRGSDTPYEAWL